MIVVTPYSSEWPSQFASAKRDLEVALADVSVIAIEHVGSTSVPGLAAKPVLDIDVIVQPDKVQAAISALQRVGYEHLGDLGLKNREAFRSPDDAPGRSVYVCTIGTLHVRNHLAVREILRARPGLRDEYARTKQNLASDPTITIQQYLDGKSDVLQRVLEAADLTPDERLAILRLNAPAGERCLGRILGVAGGNALAEDGRMDPEVEDVMRRQAEVHGDLDRLLAQAGPLSDVWTGLKMDGGDIVVLLTEPDAYEQQLRALVDHPDRLHVQQSRYTRVQLDDVHRQMTELLGEGSWKSHGPGLENVDITLRSNRTGLAELLHERFGDSIAITLGRHRFPLDSTEAVPARSAPRSTIELRDIASTVHLDEDAYRTGEDIRGHVRIHNHGTTDLEVFDGAPAFGVLLDADHHVVGGWNGAIAGVGRSVSLAPGAAMSRNLLAGSDTYDPRLGASLPPGPYLLVVSISITERAPAETRHGTVVTRPIPILLTAAPDGY